MMNHKSKVSTRLNGEMCYIERLSHIGLTFQHTLLVGYEV